MSTLRSRWLYRLVEDLDLTTKQVTAIHIGPTSLRVEFIEHDDNGKPYIDMLTNAVATGHRTYLIDWTAP